jgi:glycosyltransferase involved in cell wall biosynthesis
LIATLAAVARRRTPLVLWVGLWLHPTTLVHRVSRPLVRALYRRAASLLVYGSHVARHVADETGRRERVFVAAQAVDNARFHLHGSLRARTGPALAVGYVGRLAAGKGLDVLLDAVARTSDNIRLRVIGSGPEEHALRAQAAAAKSLGDRVEFAGYVSQEELPAALAGLDVLVLPSVTTPTFREPWGLVVNEAMSAGVAVVVTTAVGAAAGGLVVDGESGLVVPERDPVALAGALDRLACDEELRLTLAAAGRERVGRLTFTAAADAIETAVEAAIGGRK